MNFILKAYALQDIGTRTNQEDCFFPPFIDPCHFDETQHDWSFYDGTPHIDDRLFLVCDGMGGHDRGEVASRIVTMTMSRSLLKSAPIEGLFDDSLLLNAVNQSYDALLAEYDPDEIRKMGTTMALLKFHADGATVCHIGDSRVYQFRPKSQGDKKETQNSILFRTQDHARGHVLTRCMAAAKGYVPQVEINNIKDIRQGDIFLLCSDGIFENLNDDDLCALVCDPNYKGAELAQRMLRSTIDNKDNHTAIIVCVHKVMNADDVVKKESRESLMPGTVLKSQYLDPASSSALTYHVDKVLGNGAFGITYIVSANVAIKGQLGSVLTDVKVAMKEFFMHNEMKRSGADVIVTAHEDKVNLFKEKFRQEAHQLSMLSHPNIVKVLDVFEANNTIYYTMEYLSSGSLNDIIKKRDGLTEQEALGIIRQVGDALNYLHLNKMLHLDVKPANILLDVDNDKVKLIDFGMARRYNETGELVGLEAVGAGTSGYAPLEQMEGIVTQPFSPQMDVYALGATYYKMLTAITPNNAVDVRNNGLKTLPLVKKKVSDKSIEAIKAAMQPSTEKRLKTVQQFLDMLPSVDDKSLIKRKRHHSAVIYLVIFIITIALIIFFLFIG